MDSSRIDPDREYELFLRKYEHDTTVYEARFDTSRNLSAGYAGSALKILSILNGGAIVAVPAIAEVFNVAGEARIAAASSIELFCWGLVVTAFGYFFAYFAMEIDCRAVLELMETSRKGKRKDYLSRVNAADTEISKIQSDIEKHKISNEIKYKWVRVFQIAGTVAALVALGIFIAGALNARVIFDF